MLESIQIDRWKTVGSVYVGFYSTELCLSPNATLHLCIITLKGRRFPCQHILMVLKGILEKH